MRQIDIDEAKINLSRLVEEAAGGEAFVIEKAGKPLVKVVPVEPSRRALFGFMRGQIEVPEDFDRTGQAEIETMFEIGDEP